jgi:hypothetical protein
MALVKTSSLGENTSSSVLKVELNFEISHVDLGWNWYLIQTETIVFASLNSNKAEMNKNEKLIVWRRNCFEVNDRIVMT